MPKLLFLAGPWHVCARSSSPTEFKPTPDDPRPHAEVTEAFGNHLIAVEGADRYGWDQPLEVVAPPLSEAPKPKARRTTK